MDTSFFLSHIHGKFAWKRIATFKIFAVENPFLSLFPFNFLLKPVLALQPWVQFMHITQWRHPGWKVLCAGIQNVPHVFQIAAGAFIPDWASLFFKHEFSALWKVEQQGLCSDCYLGPCSNLNVLLVFSLEKYSLT